MDIQKVLSQVTLKEKALFYVKYPIACCGDRNYEDFASL